MSGARERLLASVTERLAMTGVVRDEMREQVNEFVTDGLLPVVQALMDEHAAAELEKAAEDYKRELGTVCPKVPLWPGGFSPWLRARAAALRAATEGSPT